jgi:hypothetical protein
LEPIALTCQCAAISDGRPFHRWVVGVPPLARNVHAYGRIRIEGRHPASWSHKGVVCMDNISEHVNEMNPFPKGPAYMKKDASFFGLAKIISSTQELADIEVPPVTTSEQGFLDSQGT